MSDERTPAEPEVMEPTFWRKNGSTGRTTSIFMALESR
jgi:hypothetical protein